MQQRTAMHDSVYDHIYNNNRRTVAMGTVEPMDPMQQDMQWRNDDSETTMQFQREFRTMSRQRQRDETMQHALLLHNHEWNDNDDNTITVTVGTMGAVDGLLSAMWWGTLDQKAEMQHEFNGRALLRKR